MTSPSVDSPSVTSSSVESPSVYINMHIPGNTLEVRHNNFDFGGKKIWVLRIETQEYPSGMVCLYEITRENARRIRDGAQALIEAMDAESPDSAAAPA